MPATFATFMAADGLPDNEHNAAFADSRGHLWFGALNGLAEFDPSGAPVPSAPNVYFTRILVRGEEVSMPWDGLQQTELSLAADRNQIQIEFFAAGSNSLSALRFQYRLVGVNQQWSEPAADLRVNYPVLPARRLRFEVRAIDTDGHFSANTATLDLDVAAPLWQRSWFLLLLAATLAGLSTIAYRYRVDQLLALERLRMRIATDLHDDIGAKRVADRWKRSPASRGKPSSRGAISCGRQSQTRSLRFALAPHEAFRRRHLGRRGTHDGHGHPANRRPAGARARSE